MAKSKDVSRPKTGPRKASKASAKAASPAFEPAASVTALAEVLPDSSPQTAASAEVPQAVAAAPEPATPSAAPAPDSPVESETETAPTRNPAAAAAQLRSEAAPGAAFTQDFPVELKPHQIAEGLSASHGADAESGLDYLRLANGVGGIPRLSAKGGYRLRLPDAVEAAASGRPISIKVIVRSAEGAANAKFAVIYATNDVGNSGWRRLEAGPEWSARGFDYNVPKMKDGNGDDVGILPDLPGQPGVEICFLAIHIS
jgi:hypothetical protein